MDLSFFADTLGIAAFAWVVGREVLLRGSAIHAGWSDQSRGNLQRYSDAGATILAVAGLAAAWTIKVWLPPLLRLFE